jgi:hypothetical protein
MIMPEKIIQRWTPDEDERLKSLVKQGRPDSYVAEKLKRTTEGIKSRKRKLGLLRARTK